MELAKDANTVLKRSNERYILYPNIAFTEKTVIIKYDLKLWEFCNNF